MTASLIMGLILSELASLRALLHDDDAPASALLSGLNGHVATPLPPPEAPPASYNPFPQCQIAPGIETSDEPQSNPATAPPDGYGLEETDAGESPLDQVQTGDETPTQPHPDQTAGWVADAGDAHADEAKGTAGDAGEQPAQTHSNNATDVPEDTGDSPPRPSLSPALARVLRALEGSSRPRRPWQIAKDMGLSRLPSSELSKLVQMGLVTRLRPGIYGLADRVYRDYEMAEENG